MKIYWSKVTIIGYLLITLMGCSLFFDPNTPNNAILSPTATVPFTGTQTALVSPTQGDSTSMTPTLSSAAVQGLEYLIKKAKEDLAQRLSISVTQINLIETTEVEWSDSSLDCPQPGLEYLQVITPGYRILLEFNGNEYAYHSNRDTYVVFCDSSIQLIPPAKP